MRLEFILFVGIFTNLLLASIFPYQLLPTDTAAALVGDDTYGYDLTNNGYFGTKEKAQTTSLYNSVTDQESVNTLTQATTTEVSFLESISNFFDGLFDALGKAAIYISLIIPFATVLFLLPGAMGLVFGGIYMTMVIVAIVRFIRG